MSQDAMRLGLNLPFRPAERASDPARFLADGAALIESLGFRSAWMFDAVARGFATPDPLTAMAVAATATSSIELGTGVLQLPLRHPVELANRIISVDMVAGGRFTLGVGAGSTLRDYQALGVDFETRFARFDAALDDIRRLLAGETVGAATLKPWPARRPRPRILIGAWSSGRWIRRAATEFDGWIASAGKTGWQALRAGIERFRRHRGRRAVVINVPVRVLDTDKGNDDIPDLIGTPETIRRRLGRFAALGFDDLVAAPRSWDEAELSEIAEVLGVTGNDPGRRGWAGARRHTRDEERLGT